jgi:2-polyprenyl-6-methoxyphenol hydroxylase-like FAD-dependent oxidoreductase
VMDSAHWDAHGATNEERYDHIRTTEPMITEYAGGATRLTPVMKYNNYQLVTDRFFGDGWALVGDAGGFVDPIFSSGLFLAMSSASNLTKAIVRGTPEAMQRYQRETRRLITTWQRIVDLYYAGALFTLFKVRRDQPAGPLMKIVRQHVFQHMGRVFTGEASTSRYSISLIELIARHGIKSENIDLMKIN